MNKRRLLYSTPVIVLGVFMFVFGEIDDSPGGQLLGLIVIIIGAVGVIKSRKKNPDSPPKKF